MNGKETIARIIDLIMERGRGNVFVVSALSKITDFLIDSMKAALKDEDNIPQVMRHIREKHTEIARHLISEGPATQTFDLELERSLRKLERLYYGLNFTKEITPRMYDVVSSYGERLSALLMASIIQSRGLQATWRGPHKIGLITDGKYGDATANMKKTTKNFKQNLGELLSENSILFIPGFFGISKRGDITTFGRGGSDYAAAVVAAATESDILEIWKDVDGFMSADPRLVPVAELIPLLSYEEAAELAYFGAKILHPRTVEPVRKKKLHIAIKNTLNPDAEGTLIASKSPQNKNIIKSVGHTKDIGILKVHASGVGARPGILAIVASSIAEKGINIKSVVTSQTCISLLLARDDLKKTRDIVKKIKPRPYRQIETIDDVALISIVGEGLLPNQGIAGQCFSAVAEHQVNIEMISFGPSRAALYFLTKTRDLNRAVNAIHQTFFPE